MIPSDEEIEDRAENYSREIFVHTNKPPSFKYDFIAGAKWMRDEIQHEINNLKNQLELKDQLAKRQVNRC